MTGTGHDILFPKLPYHMDDRAPAATKNVQLQQFVNHATLTKDDARKQLIPHVFGEHADDVRTLAGQIKQHTLDHPDYYLEQFIDRDLSNWYVRRNRERFWGRGQESACRSFAPTWRNRTMRAPWRRHCLPARMSRSRSAAKP